jgi:hypothetical protein
MHLKLVSSSLTGLPEFAPDPIDLARQPWRPGELCEVVDLYLGADLRERLDSAAAAQGVPIAVLLLATVEAERVIAVVAARSGRTRGEITSLLDAGAEARPERDVDPPPARRLRAYAFAILAGAHPPEQPTSPRLAIRVPQSLAAAWSLAATREESSLEDWVISKLERGELTRTRWEAAAAYAGRSLESWAALSALGA